MDDEFKHLDGLLRLKEKLREGQARRAAWVKDAQSAYRATYGQEPPPDWPGGDADHREAARLTGYVPNPGGLGYGS